MKTNLAPFLSWTQANGIITPLELVIKNSVRSMTAVSGDAPPGFCIVSPLQLVTTDSSRYMALSNMDLTSLTDDANQVNLLQVPLSACIIGDDSQSLAERLAYEKNLGAKSHYAPYIDLLPTLEDFQEMPRFWEKERREFVNKFDGGQLESRMGLDQLRFDSMDDQWALACVDSRCNFLPDSTCSMTPMLDMFNHDSRVKTTARVDQDRDLFLNVASQSLSIPQKEEQEDWKDRLWNVFGNDRSSGANDGPQEVFISYGELSNIETLCNYGFISENDCNTEAFEIRLLGQPPITLVADASGSIENNVFNQMSLQDVRLKLATADETESLQTSPSKDGTISQRNELELYALIAGELEEAIYKAKSGAKEAQQINDELVVAYFRGRQATLEKTIDAIKIQYPQIF
jgi:hypothetical protein